jgi:hypothetical protein
MIAARSSAFARALLATLGAPGRVGRAGRRDRALRLGGAEIGHFGDESGVGGIGHGEALAAIGADPGAVDEGLRAEQGRVLELHGSPLSPVDRAAARFRQETRRAAPGARGTEPRQTGRVVECAHVADFGDTDHCGAAEKSARCGRVVVGNPSGSQARI